MVRSRTRRDTRECARNRRGNLGGLEAHRPAEVRRRERGLCLQFRFVGGDGFEPPTPAL
jgi:hypothetical protein